MVFTSALMTAKATLYLAVKDSGMSVLAMSRKLGIELKTLQRMMDPRQRTHIGSIENTLADLGMTLEVEPRQQKAA